MTDMANFYFERECRTPHSECYTILEENGPVGRLDLHFTSAMVHGTLTVAESLTQEGIQEIVSIVDENIIDAIGLQRDDFVLHVHQGRDLGVYTNNEMGMPPPGNGHPPPGA